MDRNNLKISLAATVLALCAYYRGGFRLLPIVLLPIAAHELSHILALRMLGQDIEGLTLSAHGLCIRYGGACGPAGHILAALAGPLGGAVYALAASRCAGVTGYEWLEQSAGLSLLLTAFNLLPLMPLDGGRVFSQLCTLRLGEERGMKFFRSLNAALLSLLLTGGVAFAVWKKSTAPLAAAIWLLLFWNEME